MVIKRLSDVEVVAEPTESANVLIEEDGIIKKAPKTAVGGAGGGDEYDAVFHAFFGDDWFGLDEISADNVVLVSGGYENIKNKLINQDEMPKVILRWQACYGNYRYRTLQFNSIYVEDHDDSNITIEGLILDFGDLFSIKINLSSDNSIVEMSVSTP